MDARIVVDRVWLSEDGRRINYDYRATGSAARYFDGCPAFYARYEVDLTDVPESLLMVPVVANLAPIAWFAGIPLDVPVLDARFIRALEDIKSIFLQDYPHLRGPDSVLNVAHSVETKNQPSAKAMLFSGGVDAYTTFFRHRAEGVELVSIHGADIPVDDDEQWKTLVKLTAAEPILATYGKRNIEANLRDFYTYRVNQLVPSNSWWGSVQHGLALTSLLAPLSAKRGYGTVYIASSYTEAIQILWGSTPEIDGRIAWSACSVVHDGYELRRVDKIGLIVSEAANSRQKVNLRVCYSELNAGLNCSRCEKCYRTILGLSLFGADPNDFGLSADSQTYVRILQFIQGGFSTQGSRYFWWELHQRMISSPDFHHFAADDSAMRSAIESALARALAKPLPVKRFQAKKMALIANFPKAFALYLKARRLFV